MSFVCHNGLFLPSVQPILRTNNHSYKWGDGIFETIKFYEGKILLQQFHFDRLLMSLRLLQVRVNFSLQELIDNIQALCKMNNCLALARVRLAVYRTDENDAGYTIEAIKLDQASMQLNTEGYVIDVYPYARKACDVFANLKTANYLPYVMADLYAKERSLQEAIILNSFNQLCDASKANIFCIKGKEVFTPALDQGCINGVMRRFVMEEAKKSGWIVKQTILTETMLNEADECFLTNAIQGIRWVRQYRDKHFTAEVTTQIFKTLFDYSKA